MQFSYPKRYNINNIFFNINIDINVNVYYINYKK